MAATIWEDISAATEAIQERNIIHSPSFLFLLKKQRKKTTDNTSDKFATLDSNALIFHQI